MTEPNYCTPGHSIEYKVKDASSNEQRTCLITTDAHGMTVAIGGQVVVLDVANGDVRVFICEDGEEIDEPVAVVPMEHTPLRKLLEAINSAYGKGSVSSITIEDGDSECTCHGSVTRRIPTTQNTGYEEQCLFAMTGRLLRFLGRKRKLPK
jgi:hypothetical protein